MVPWGLKSSYHYFRKVVKVVGWFGGDVPTSSKWFETKLPRILYGQGVLSQKMASYNPKVAEWSCGASKNMKYLKSAIGWT